MSRVIKSSFRVDGPEPYRTSPARPEELELNQRGVFDGVVSATAGAADGISASEDARLQALVDAAQERAAKIVAKAREEADSIREEARRTGFAEGFAEGREQGESAARREAREAVDQVLRLLGRVAEEVTASRAKAASDLSGELLKLAMQIAEKIIRARVRFDREMAARAVADALRLMVGHSRVLVRLNPVDLEAVCRLEPDFRQHLGPSALLEIVSDEGVEPGGCLVETSVGVVDARLATQLEEIGAAVREVMADGQGRAGDTGSSGGLAGDNAGHVPGA